MRSTKKQLPRKKDARTFRPSKSWLVMFEQDEVDESLYIGGGPDDAKDPGANGK